MPVTRRLASDYTSAQIAEQLNAAGLRTGKGRPFTTDSVQWLLWRHKIPHPTSWAHDDELTVGKIAERLSISAGTVYDWIRTGTLAARRGPANRLYIPFPPDVERQCRERVQNSVHLSTETKNRAAGGAV